VRRILRRAVRYYYSFLDIKEPFVYKLIPLLADFFGDVFPELKGQVDFISKVIQEEERSFLRTLAEGLKRFDQLENSNGIVAGKAAFELYDTYGFPIDLTRLIAEERGLKVDEPAFQIALEEQKSRGRADAKKEVSDWEQVKEGSVEFIGYDHHKNEDTHLLKYRTVKIKDKNQFQMVLDKTPFYPEGGGQVGDKGLLFFGDEKVQVLNTLKENDLIIHVVDKIPTELSGAITAQINTKKRGLTENNHTATHLMHAALREVLGDHVQQKGSLVNEKYFRFDFSHFQKMTPEEIAKVEQRVNEKIRENISLQEDRSIPIAQAKESGAMMLFGEKYGDEVRMITFDPEYSRELCGGCHVNATGVIGQFKITSESAIAAGVRRIEALTSIAAEEYVNKEIAELTAIRSQFKNPKNVSQSVQSLIEDNKELKKQVEQLLAKEAGNLKGDLISKFENVNGINFLSTEVSITDTKALKHLISQLDHEIENAFIVIGTHSNGKAQLMVSINKDLTKAKDLHAGNIVKELAKEINGGGGGQAFFASAGGTKVEGLNAAITKAKSFL
jgi:alanyl-tRNA synthetase